MKDERFDDFLLTAFFDRRGEGIQGGHKEIPKTEKKIVFSCKIGYDICC